MPNHGTESLKVIIFNINFCGKKRKKSLNIRMNLQLHPENRNLFLFRTKCYIVHFDRTAIFVKEVEISLSRG